MEKKIVGIFVCALVITTCVLPAYSVNSTVFHSTKKWEIFEEIEEIDDKKLVIDKLIGDVNVKYWEHKINEIIIKNDYILLHLSLENEKIVKYEKTWTNIVLQNYLELPKIYFENYSWKQAVVFPEIDDLGYFYRLYADQVFPLVCWEIRYVDGNTMLYDLDGNRIGSGIPAPSGFSLSGYHNESLPDPWERYRENADFWFSKWCDTTASLSLPNPSIISSYIRDSNVINFFEMAHGTETNFQADSAGIIYTSIMVQNDISARPPMKFAFIGSCHGMTTTGPGTFSYEFRKGQMNDTVTIGFDHMETCPGWEYGFPWQNSLFENMSNGVTIKNAFDLATAQYPTIAPAVVFLGDQNLVVFLPPSKPRKPLGPSSGNRSTTYSYSTNAIDLNGDKVKYGWDWNGDNIVDQWDDNNGSYYSSGVTITTSHSWSNKGIYNLKVKAQDIFGGESVWSDPLPITMSYSYNKPIRQFLELLFQRFPPRISTTMTPIGGVKNPYLFSFFIDSHKKTIES